MKRFNFWMSPKLREKVEKDMQTSGHLGMAAFIRSILWKYPNSDNRWSDEDMKVFAKNYHENPPRIGPLDTHDSVLTRSFHDFKTSRQ